MSDFRARNAVLIKPRLRSIDDLVDDLVNDLANDLINELISAPAGIAADCGVAKNDGAITCV